MFPEFKKATLIGFYKIDRTEMFPRLVDDHYLEEIHGSLIQINESELKDIDRYEGYPDLYDRKEVTVHTSDGRYTAWVYY